MDLDAPRILVLNLGYEVLGLTSPRRGVTLVMSEIAEVVVESPEALHTPGRPYPVPSIIRIKRMVRRPYGRLSLSRRNIFRRDHNTCQYCGRVGGDLTIDHVIPRSRGGKTAWENLTTACHSCNAKKRNFTPEEAGMSLRHKPKVPHPIELLALPASELPLAWQDFLPRAPSESSLRHPPN